jgi:Ca-activated chloride channel family protein
MSELLANFHFMRPTWLLAALVVLPVGWLLYRRLGAGKAWSSIISDQLLPYLLSGGRAASKWPLWVLLLAWIIAVLALAGPSWERLPQPVERREHALVVLYDLSLSMYATDITPSRLVRSRQKLLDLLEKKTEGTTGLVAYAGDAHVVSPLTDDLRTIANLMPALTPDIMPVRGSRPARAVEQAVRLLRDSGLEHGQILLVTDGIHRGDSDEIAEALSNTRYRLSVLGIGTSDGSPIPTSEGFLRDNEGGIVVAGLDRKPLRALATRFGGSYSDLELGDKDLEQILALDPFDEDETQEMLGRSVDTWEDMGYWLTLLLLPVALGAFRRGYILCLLLLPLAVPGEAQTVEGAAGSAVARNAEPPSGAARGLRDYFLNRDQLGSELLAAEQAEAAAEVFEDPAWKATANYRAGNFDKALELYQQDDSADGFYNRGNSLARAGDLQAAIDAYSKALELAPEMEDAAFNKALLEQLQQQQQDQQQQNQDQNQQNQDQNQQNQDQQQDQQSQQQDQQSQDGEQDQQQQQAQNEPSDPQDPQDSEPQQQQSEQQQKREQQQAQNSEQEPGEQQQQAARERDPDELEREMANEQWLRRIPDDPSGLLRRKFRYQSRLRAQENPNGADQDEDNRW